MGRVDADGYFSIVDRKKDLIIRGGYNVYPREIDERRIDGKGSLRAVWQAEITLTDLRVPQDNRLPGANSFKDTGRVLAGTRNTVAWADLGHATAAYEIAVAYCKQNKQFGKPLVCFQIVPDRLRQDARRGAPSTRCAAPPRPADRARQSLPTPSPPSQDEQHTQALQVIAEARDLLGGNGILLDFQ